MELELSLALIGLAFAVGYLVKGVGELVTGPHVPEEIRAALRTAWAECDKEDPAVYWKLRGIQKERLQKVGIWAGALEAVETERVVTVKPRYRAN